MKRAIKELGNKAIDRRTAMGKALANWRANLVQDLGGESNLTTQQLGIIDLAIRTKLMIDSIDHWILAQPSLIDPNRQALIPVVRERTQLADSLARYLAHLGLDRKAKPVVSLDDYLESKYSQIDGTGEGEEEANTDT